MKLPIMPDATFIGTQNVSVSYCTGSRFDCANYEDHGKDRLHVTHPADWVALWRMLSVIIATRPEDAKKFGSLTDNELIAAQLAADAAPEPERC